MNDILQDTPKRLDSWKAIAAYLDRDERTTQRWERELGLPVRRVPGGRGRSVFAYAHEIDEWLRTAAIGAPTAPPVVSPELQPQRRTRRRIVWPALAAAFVLIAVLAWRFYPATPRPGELSFQSSKDGVIAFDATGSRRWVYPFPPAYRTYLAEDMPDPVRVAPGGRPAVYVGTAFRIRRDDGAQETGTLAELDSNGRQQRSFTFADAVNFDGTTYGPPWVITDFAIDETGGARRIAIAAHHAVWSASLVTVLDEHLQRHGTFVHAGWIEQVRWKAPNRLVIGGFSNAHDGGMVALLDPTVPGGVDGQGPEPPGSAYFCRSCPAGTALVRMAVMPRTELNRATASRFNRARIELTRDGIMARTIEVPALVGNLDSVEALYEFTSSLDLQRASYGDHYREVARTLEAQGRIRLAASSAAGDRPAELLHWDRQSGWRTLRIR